MRAAMLLAMAILTSVSGCASPRGNKVAELEHRQERWWAENRDRATYVPGKGYYVQQAGYFEADGRLKAAEGEPYAWLTQAPMHDSANDVASDEDDGGVPISKLLSPEGLWEGARTAVGKGKDVGLARQFYQEGDALFRERKFAEAKAKFKAAAGRWPHSDLEEDAIFKAAECDLFTEGYAAADDGYANLLKKYPASRHLDQVNRRQFAIAQYWQHLHRESSLPRLVPNFTDSRRPLMDTPGRSLKLYQYIFEKNSTSDLADEALMAMADTLYNSGKFEDADVYYTMLRRQYPHSEHQFQAHLRGMHAKLRMYQGADYDDKPLKEAERLAEQILAQYADRDLAVRENVLKVRKEITALKAQRDWVTAEYYAKRKEYRAAREHYSLIAREYPRTSFAEQALARLEQQRGKPDVAPHPLEWALRWMPGQAPAPSPEATRVGTRRSPGSEMQ